MILKKILSELETAEAPVVKKLREGQNFHVLAIGLRKNIKLKKHTSNLPARIVVLKGEIVYHNQNSETKLELYGEYEIPVDEVHRVTANKDSLFLVIKGY